MAETIGLVVFFTLIVVCGIAGFLMRTITSHEDRS